MLQPKYWLSEENKAQLGAEIRATITRTLQDACTRDETILLTCTPETPDANITTIMVMLGMAQYDPEWIGHLAARKIDLEFTDAQGRQVPPMKWLMLPEMQNWFSMLGKYCPAVIVFLNQWEAVFMAVASDIVGGMSHDEVQWENEGQGAILHLSPMENTTIKERVIYGCCMFMDYCNNTGADPEESISELFQKFGYPFSYEALRSLWKEKLMNNEEKSR